VKGMKIMMKIMKNTMKMKKMNLVIMTKLNK
jgi:hypothetical protein